MKNINKIKERVDNIFESEITRTEKEIADFEQKQRDNDTYYGCGGWHTQYQKAIDRRKDHIETLKQIRGQSARAIELDTFTLYPFYCPECNLEVLLNMSMVKNHRDDTIDCPICYRPIYRTCRKKTWNIQRGSEYAETIR